MSVTITVGTPPHGPNPRRVRVGLLKLNEITRLVIVDDEEEAAAAAAAAAAGAGEAVEREGDGKGEVR